MTIYPVPVAGLPPWKPVWAMVLAASGLVLPLLELLGAVGMAVGYLLDPHAMFAGIGLYAAGLLALVALAGAVPLGIFLAFGGKAPLTVGLALLAGELMCFSLLRLSSST